MAKICLTKVTGEAILWPIPMQQGFMRLRKEFASRMPWAVHELTVDGEAANFAFVVMGSAETDFQKGRRRRAYTQYDHVKGVLESSGLGALYEARWSEDKPPELRVRPEFRSVKEVFPPRSGSFTTFQYQRRLFGFL